MLGGWQTLLNFLIMIESASVSLVSVLTPLSGLQMTSVFWVALYYPGIDYYNYGLITASLKC